MNNPIRYAVILAVLLVAAPLFAATDSPVGTWKTIDDETGQDKSLVQITEENGELSGKVIKVINSDEGPNPICKKCEGERKDQPVVGMTIMWGLKHNGDKWDGGQILDPNNGKTYKCKLQLTDGGEKLEMRGYMGFSLLGRTQTWVRQPE